MAPRTFSRIPKLSLFPFVATMRYGFKLSTRLIFVCLVGSFSTVPLLRLGEVHCLSSATQKSTLVLKVDTRSGARALYSGLAVFPSVGGSLQFFDRSLYGTRKLFLKGPWPGSNFRGNLTQISENKYVLASTNAGSGAEYRITYEQLPANTLELSFDVRAPNMGNTLQIEILKLCGDMFKGSLIEASPSSMWDPQRFPVNPLKYGKSTRVMLRKKDKVGLKTRFCDLEITDLTRSRSINVADFRTVPWDKHKSFKLYAIKHGLAPGSLYTFKYSIRFFPRSVSDAGKKQENTSAELKSRVVSLGNPWRFFAIPPKKENLELGCFELKSSHVIYGHTDGIAAGILAKELRELGGFGLEIKPLPTNPPAEGILVGTHLPGLKEVASLPSEGFEVSITQKRITVRGQDQRGCLYGVYSLLSRLRKNNGKWVFQKGNLLDWPDVGLRGICTVSLRPAIRDVALFKRYIKAFSRARANIVIFYHHPEQVLAWKNGIDEGWWKQEQMAEIARYARSLQMEVWTGFRHKFDAQRFPDLEIARGSNLYNPFAKSSYLFLFSLYDTLLQTYQPSTFLIGHDEINGLSLYASDRDKNTAEILAKDVERIYKWLKARGVKTAMFGDMLLDSSRWGSIVGAAHSGEPFRNSGTTDTAIDRIPKDIKILDWHYAERPYYPSIDYFKDKGFQVLGCSWHDPIAAKSMASSVKSYGGEGIIGFDWRFWETLSPSATTLCSLTCGWSNKYAIGQKDEDVSALAVTLRPTSTILKGKQEPVTMNSAFNDTTWDSVSTDNRGVFNLGPMLDLRSFLSGRQKLGRVLFDLHLPVSGNQNNCLVVGLDRSGNSYPVQYMSIDHKDMRTEGLAFLHTCYVEEPRYLPRVIGTYVIAYADGDTVSIPIKEGWNITDVRSIIGLRKFTPGFFRSPDILIGAELVWHGKSEAGLPLNVQVIVWENPLPYKRIENIKILAHKIKEKQRVRIALLGITALKRRVRSQEPPTPE